MLRQEQGNVFSESTNCLELEGEATLWKHREVLLILLRKFLLSIFYHVLICHILFLSVITTVWSSNF